MGTYLSTPVTEKCEEEGTHLTCSQTPVAWGVVDMQGWRKSMEDAHVATTMDDFKVFGVFDGHGGAEVARICQLYMVSVLTQQPTWQQALDNVPYEGNPAQSPLGLALRSSFHALDRMIGDPERRDELVALRTNKPGPGERKDAENIPPPRQFVTMDESMVQPSSSADASTVSLMDKAEDNSGTTSPASPQSMDTLSNGETPTPKENVSQEAVEEEKKGDDELMEHEQEDDSDSDEAVGQQEAANDRNLDDDESPDGEADESVPASGKMTEMFQRLLHMSGSPANGTGVVKLGGVGGENSSPLQPVSAPGAVGSSPYTFSASTLHAGRMICTLPDHPIHAGATAVVAVMIGKTLVVANAGDSRAVLCRDGAAFALSYDHKPQQDQESSRIRKAGGFVNQFGRVNGNLNLSRSIGDLKYKQAYFLPPAKQMITAEPDIIETKIDDTDEFLLIGCDGIWDCLSNEQAVVYVRQRIDTKTPVEIGREMLDDIISVDPRATQGIGGDNMTILIIDLQPHKRSYRQREE